MCNVVTFHHVMVLRYHYKQEHTNCELLCYTFKHTPRPPFGFKYVVSSNYFLQIIKCNTAVGYGESNNVGFRL